MSPSVIKCDDDAADLRSLCIFPAWHTGEEFDLQWRAR